MTARARRRVVERVRAATGISERRAVQFTGFPRSTIRYRSVRPPQETLCARLRSLAAERPRWGYRRLHTLVQREGWAVNRKRVQRLYREEGLAVRRRGKRRRSQPPRPVREPVGCANARWSMDFLADTLSSGRTFRCLTIVDEFTRECVAIHAGHAIPAVRVIEVLEQLRVRRGLPKIIITDNGSEFTSRAFDAWAYARGIKLEFIQPGKPVQNAFVESFNGTLRDECLNLHWFVTLDDARRTIAAWRQDYNRVRPHSSLGRRTPAEFASQHAHTEGNLVTISSAGVPE